MLNSSEPWPHHVEDNFLSQNEFNLVREYSSKWFHRGERFFMPMMDFKFFEETKDHYETGMIVDSIFEQYRGWHEELYQRDLSNFFMLKEFVVINDNYHYPPHTDAKLKLISSVLYFSDEGKGTRLSKNERMEDPYQIEWKPNRLVTFSRTNNTWHDYFCDGKRVTFNLIFLDAGRYDPRWWAGKRIRPLRTSMQQGFTRI